LDIRGLDPQGGILQVGFTRAEERERQSARSSPISKNLTHFSLMDLFFATAPIILLIYLMAKPNGMPSQKALPLVALLFVVKWKELKRNLVFVCLSIASCVVPYFIIGLFSYEFPSLIGGMIGFGITILLARLGIGLEKREDEAPAQSDAAVPAPGGVGLVKALFPLWGTVLVLLVTRIPELGLKALLNSTEGGWHLALGSLGSLHLSKSLVIAVSDIFGTKSERVYQLFYVPALVPFGLVSLLTFLLYRMDFPRIKGVFSETGRRIVNPLIALLGALVYVQLLMTGGDSASTKIIGESLANAIGGSWQYFASYLGAVGSFFSGSNTVSNLTFGAIQYEIAGKLGLNPSTILAIQSVGGAMGNMVCINNIVAICSILGLSNAEGRILRLTAGPMILYGVIIGIVAAVVF
jgi:lactate permease